MNIKIIGSIVAAIFILVAFFVKPTRADHEQFIANHFSNSQDQALGQGEILKWVLGKGVDLARSGQFESGILSSTYLITIAGTPIAKCTGIVTYITCSSIK